MRIGLEAIVVLSLADQSMLPGVTPGSIRTVHAAPG